MTNKTTPARLERPTLDGLPEWPLRTIAVLATVDQGPYAIPVSAPLRAGDRRIVLSLRSSRGSLARLRAHPQVALAVLTADNIAFTALGRAHVFDEPLAGTTDYVGVAIDVEQIADHRHGAFVIESGIDRRWLDEDEQRALMARVAILTEHMARVVPDPASPA
jgi:pyridoxamine 5'-phosphate oxidase-like protein